MLKKKKKGDATTKWQAPVISRSDTIGLYLQFMCYKLYELSTLDQNVSSSSQLFLTTLGLGSSK
jgi:hypothetical protein